MAVSQTPKFYCIISQTKYMHYNTDHAIRTIPTVLQNFFGRVSPNYHVGTKTFGLSCEDAEDKDD